MVLVQGSKMKERVTINVHTFVTMFYEMLLKRIKDIDKHLDFVLSDAKH